MKTISRIALFALALLVSSNGYAGQQRKLAAPNLGYTVASVSGMTAEEHLAAARSTADAMQVCNSSFDRFFLLPSSVRFRDELKRNCEVAFRVGQYAVFFAANPALGENVKAAFKVRPNLIIFYSKALNEIELQAAMMSANADRLSALGGRR